ncbi:glycosyltransferase family 1 protein [Bacillus megaterium]|nr:glycosyltransferase family 1 protein [Priestia megaterium]
MMKLIQHIKGYKVMLNVNSVKYSQLCFSRRVFEGLACGTPIISSYSEGVKRMFKDIVLISENKQIKRIY